MSRLAIELRRAVLPKSSGSPAMIGAFATRPAETADDNNIYIYASALACILPTPGLRAEEVFKGAQLKVADLTKGRQIPWTEDGLLVRFKFKEAAPDAEVELAYCRFAKADGTKLSVGTPFGVSQAVDQQ